MLCVYLLNHFSHVGEGVSADAKNTWKLRQDYDLLHDIVACHFYTRWIHMVVYIMTVLTGKAAQVTKSVGKLSKIHGSA